MELDLSLTKMVIVTKEVSVVVNAMEKGSSIRNKPKQYSKEYLLMISSCMVFVDILTVSDTLGWLMIISDGEMEHKRLMEVM